MAKYSRKLGHDVTVVERRYDLSDPLEEFIDGIKYLRLKAKKRAGIPYNEIKNIPFGPYRLLADALEFSVKINRIICHNSFDIIHVHYPFAANCLINLNKKVRHRMIYTAHIGEEKARLRLGKDMPFIWKYFSPDLYLMRRARKTVLLNEVLCKNLQNNVQGIRLDQLEVIPNGVELSDYESYSKGRIRAKYGLGDKVIVFFAGSITPRKGIDCLLNAVDNIVNKHGINNVAFLLAGSMHLEPGFVNDLKDYVNMRQLGSVVTFLDFVQWKELKEYYHDCDIFVLPSLQEGDPIVLKEAMASGKPVVATHVGNIPAQVRDNWNGFLVSPGNENELSTGLLKLINNVEMRGAMGENSRVLIRDNFSWEMVTVKYIQAYNKVIR